MRLSKRIEIIFVWYDFCFGLFWDSKRKILYFFPLPMLGLKIKFGHRVITYCPECHNETNEVVVYHSGEESTGEYTVHWFEGYGKCSECDWQGYYSDSD